MLWSIDTPGSTDVVLPDDRAGLTRAISQKECVVREGRTGVLLRVGKACGDVLHAGPSRSPCA
jgi:hypothetical protein